MKHRTKKKIIAFIALAGLIGSSVSLIISRGGGGGGGGMHGGGMGGGHMGGMGGGGFYGGGMGGGGFSHAGMGGGGFNRATAGGFSGANRFAGSGMGRVNPTPTFNRVANPNIGRINPGVARVNPVGVGRGQLGTAPRVTTGGLGRAGIATAGTGRIASTPSVHRAPTTGSISGHGQLGKGGAGTHANAGAPGRGGANAHAANLGRGGAGTHHPAGLGHAPQGVGNFAGKQGTAHLANKNWGNKNFAHGKINPHNFNNKNWFNNHNNWVGHRGNWGWWWPFGIGLGLAFWGWPLWWSNWPNTVVDTYVINQAGETVQCPGWEIANKTANPITITNDYGTTTIAPGTSTTLCQSVNATVNSALTGEQLVLNTTDPYIYVYIDENGALAFQTDAGSANYDPNANYNDDAVAAQVVAPEQQTAPVQVQDTGTKTYEGPSVHYVPQEADRKRREDVAPYDRYDAAYENRDLSDPDMIEGSREVMSYDGTPEIIGVEG